MTLLQRINIYLVPTTDPDNGGCTSFRTSIKHKARDPFNPDVRLQVDSVRTYNTFNA